LAHNRHRPLRTQRPLLGHHVLEIGALNTPHVDIKLAANFPTVVYGHYVRLVQPSGGSRLAKEPLAKLLILRVLGPKQLQGHHTIHHSVFGFPHLAESTAPEQPPERVVPKPRTRLQTPRAIKGLRLVHYTLTTSAARRCTHSHGNI